MCYPFCEMLQPRDKAAAFWDRGRAKTHVCCISHILWIAKCFIISFIYLEKFYLSMKWKLFSLKSSGKTFFGISCAWVEIFRQSVSKSFINWFIRLLKNGFHKKNFIPSSASVLQITQRTLSRCRISVWAISSSFLDL